MKRTICVVTGTRAEYGLLRWVMQGIQETHDLTLQIIATGMHLSPEFGLTYREIEKDGFQIVRKIEMLTSSDTSVGISKSMGLGIIGFADALSELTPDLLVVLGDRFEIFSAVAAALVARIPVAHLHGGETTEGAFDESIRHAITKMSHLHFVAAEEYRRRVIQLGEQPQNVYLVGGLGIDSIKHMKLLGRSELEAELGFRFGRRNLLITYHPTTLDSVNAVDQLRELLMAVVDLKETELIFTLPNADTESRELIQMLRVFAERHAHAHVFTSLGQLYYLSCMALVDGVVGNSSSGLLEAPSFRTGTINIGDRQRGRLQAESVINCPPNREHIEAALQRLFSEEFKMSLCRARNPYGDGGASSRIVTVLQDVKLDGLLRKKFYSIGGECCP
jgi:GDP/UDP-N,N'-diacetylbacillosamine 2-epimerase (hydrolysing)